MTPTLRVAYDANGNTLTDAQGRSFTWDFENRLVQAVVSGTGTTTFKYDPFGRRIQKSGPLVTTNYLYDGSNLIEDMDNAGNALTRYAQGWNVDEPLSELRFTTASYYQADGLASISSLSNSAATLTNTYNYDSFGKLTSSTGTITNPFQYTSREFDPETGQYHYRSRHYDPTLGRFNSEDAVRFMGGINFYAYALNQPTNYTDPHGFAPQGTCACVQGQGLEKAKQCCADAEPVSADDPGPNPYSPCQTYMKVNAAGMYRWGGNGRWGQVVRGCLMCALRNGASMSDAHHYCYKRGLDRTGYWNGFTGFTRAVGGALLTVGLQITYPNPNDPTLECLNVK